MEWIAEGMPRPARYSGHGTTDRPPGVVTMSNRTSRSPVAVYFDTNSLHSKSGGYDAPKKPPPPAPREIAGSVKLPLPIPQVVADELHDRLARRVADAFQVLRERAEFIADALNEIIPLRLRPCP